MPDSIEIQLNGYSFQLLADGGLFWPTQSILFVADTHFGKEATFRRGGIPVPVGATDATLVKIKRMLSRTHAFRLCILGDMFHARSSISPDVREALEHFFAEFSRVKILLIRGNHDMRVGSLPYTWPIEILDPGTMIESVSLGHHPAELPTGATVYLCGHVHPAVQVSSTTERLGKMPCFWHSRGQLVLPAVGEFTGTHVVTLSDGDNVWLAVENQIYRYR